MHSVPLTALCTVTDPAVFFRTSGYRVMLVTLARDIAELQANEVAMQTFRDEFKVSLRSPLASLGLSHSAW
jgi:hypothetical protein